MVGFRRNNPPPSHVGIEQHDSNRRSTNAMGVTFTVTVPFLMSNDVWKSYQAGSFISDLTEFGDDHDVGR
jgi:hypothetical protein